MGNFQVHCLEKYSQEGSLCVCSVIMYSPDIHFYRLSDLEPYRFLCAFNVWQWESICLTTDSPSVSVWKYTTSSSDLMVLSKCEMWLLVTSYSSSDFCNRLVLSCADYEESWACKTMRKWSQIWKHLGKFTK